VRGLLSLPAGVNGFTPAGRESYTGTETRPLLHKEAGNCLTEKLTRQDATDPKQKAVTDYKEQADRCTPSPPNHQKTKKQESQYNHNGHNNQKPNQ